MTGRHPGPQGMLRWFEYGHLQPDLAQVSRLSKLFADLARTLHATLGDGLELTAALRKLLEAKDCAVRQAILDHDEVDGYRRALRDAVDGMYVSPPAGEEWGTTDAYAAAVRHAAQHLLETPPPADPFVVQPYGDKLGPNEPRLYRCGHCGAIGTEDGHITVPATWPQP